MNEILICGYVYSRGGGGGGGGGDPCVFTQGIKRVSEKSFARRELKSLHKRNYILRYSNQSSSFVLLVDYNNNQNENNNPSTSIYLSIIIIIIIISHLKNSEERKLAIKKS